MTLSTLCVGTGAGGSTNMLAYAPNLFPRPSKVLPVLRRVTVIDFQGQTLMDSYVLPTMPVVDYRTATTGIDASVLNASTF